MITFFTIAHSITLTLAALDMVRCRRRIVEPAIAASIVYVGLENIFGKHRFAWRHGHHVCLRFGARARFRGSASRSRIGIDQRRTALPL